VTESDPQIRGVLTRLVPGCRRLLVAFGGLNQRPGLPVFEFLRVTDEIPVNRIYLRDEHLSWYHAGVAGMSTSIDGTVDPLRALMAEHGSERCVMVGNSAGGYAAILFGVLCGADEVVSFVPQTFLDRRQRIRNRDRRFGDWIPPLRAAPYWTPRYADLANLPFTGAPVIRIHHARGYRLDRAHARHLDGRPGVELVPYDQARRRAHGIVRRLRSEGTLLRLLTHALQVDDESRVS
jgi:pimeloyl-ACP methyl ester carboxylesterase